MKCDCIFLCAGIGSRLWPYTRDRPKWLLPFRGRPILQYLVSAAHRNGVSRVVIVRGMLGGAVRSPGLNYVEDVDGLNMVNSLFKARSFFGHQFIVSYGDILYEPSVFSAAMAGEGDISVVVDHDWFDYYAARSEFPLSIAESLVLEGERIVEIGQPIRGESLPMGQYIGLIKFNETVVDKVQAIYDELRDEYWGKPWRNAPRFEMAYMTDLLQEFIDRGLDVRQVPIHGGWIELDTGKDYESLLAWDERGTLSRFIDADLLPACPTVVSAGGVVIRKMGSCVETVLVEQGARGNWRIPKGMQESGETLADTARREVLEETGISAEIVKYIDCANWLYDYRGERWEEWAHFFVMTPVEACASHDSETLSLKWVSLPEATSNLQFDTERNIMHSAASLLEKQALGSG